MWVEFNNMPGGTRFGRGDRRGREAGITTSKETYKSSLLETNYRRKDLPEVSIERIDTRQRNVARMRGAGRERGTAIHRVRLATVVFIGHRLCSSFLHTAPNTSPPLKEARVGPYSPRIQVLKITEPQSEHCRSRF